MATVAVYNMQGAEVGKMDLNDAIFGVEVNEQQRTLGTCVRCNLLVKSRTILSSTASLGE